MSSLFPKERSSPSFKGKTIKFCLFLMSLGIFLNISVITVFAQQRPVPPSGPQRPVPPPPAPEQPVIPPPPAPPQIPPPVINIPAPIINLPAPVVNIPAPTVITPPPMNQNTNVSSSNANSNVNNNTNIAQAQGGAGGFANVNISRVAPAAVQPVVVQPAPVVVARQAVPVAQVSGVSFIKQLPATGLSEIALASLGLIPLGSILKAYKSGIKGKEKNQASYIWQKRQFDYQS